jgi:uncharacterized protein (TIGR03086 family)
MASIAGVTTTDEPPYFPAPVLAELSEPEPTWALLEPVLDRLAAVVGAIEPDQFPISTPCATFDLGELRAHVLGWLGFFGAALTDPRALRSRPKPETFQAPTSAAAGVGLVLEAKAAIHQALLAGVLAGRVTMSASQMDGPAAVGMVLGEYLLHGWDLARAAGLDYSVPTEASTVTLDYFSQMIVPEYRGGEGGFFGAEVPVPAGAEVLDRLLGFAGRDPGWRR